MGAVDVARQSPNVRRMQLLGTEVRPVTHGDATLRAAIDEALRHWVSDPSGTFYILGSVVGPHPYPWLVREFQSVIGREARAQCLEATGELPDVAVACVGGGSNAMGLFHPFLDTHTALLGIEPGGRGPGLGDHAATLAEHAGVLHGTYSLLHKTPRSVIETHSVSAGLDYSGVGPTRVPSTHGPCHLRDRDRRRAMTALAEVCSMEGILPVETATPSRVPSAGPPVIPASAS